MTTPTADPWSVPSEVQSGDRFDVKGAVGRLLLITPKEYKEHVKTKFNEDADLVVADVVAIGAAYDTEAQRWSPTEDLASYAVFENVWLMQGRLIGKTKGKVGQGMVLGRLVEGEDVGKGNRPYDLEDPTPEDSAKARTYYDAKMAPSF